MNDSCQLGIRALALIAIPALLTGCQGAQVEKTMAPPRVNVVLISIDTLRPDHLGCYGYAAPSSPRIDEFCQESVVFRQAIAQAPSTLHSHASILSSLLPHHHQATWGGKTRLPVEALTLAEVLQQNGFSTAAFTGGGQMDRVFGLDQGFDLYDQPGQEHFLGTVQRGIEWLDSQAREPFLLFLHSYEVHHPYTPSQENLELFEQAYSGSLPDEISIDVLREINNGERALEEGDLAHIIAAYDAEIRSVDAAFGVLIDALKERDLYGETLIVFTSDHGEEFGEHGIIGWHSHTLYDELLRIPLIFKLPASRQAGTVVEELVRGLDIPPTVVGEVGLKIPPEFEGESLVERIAKPEIEPLFAVSRLDRRPGHDVDSIRTGEWKLMREGLFNLQKDPEELWLVSDAYTIGRLRDRLAEMIAAREPHEEVEVVPSDKNLEELRALGYIQ